MQNIWNPTIMRHNKFTILILALVESFNLQMNQVGVEDDEAKTRKEK